LREDEQFQDIVSTSPDSSASQQNIPLDGSITLLEMYDWHREHSQNRHLFVYACQDGSTREIYWPEAVAAMYVGAKIIKGRVGLLQETADVPLVAILLLTSH